MTLPPLLDGAVGRSSALYSNWLYLKPLSLLIDAGDGCAIDLGRRVGSPRVLAITHGHSDHILGLPNLIPARQFGTLTSGGPLTIVHPPDCPNLAAIRELLARMWTGVTFERLTWTPLAPGERFALDDHRTIVPFRTQHVDCLPTQGYVVLEHRHRLTAEARRLPQPELMARIRADGRASVEEVYDHPLLVHTGDTMPVDHALFQGADVMIYDTTFLDVADRGYPSHAALPEVLEIAAARAVKTLVLHHVSMRYERATLLDAVRSRIHNGAHGPSRILLWDDRAIHQVR